MTEENNHIACQSLDLEQIRVLLDEEFNAFSRDYRIRPIPESLELRALLIAWVCVFLPEAISNEFKSKVEDFLTTARTAKDFIYKGWYSVLNLEIALFAVTKRDFWLENHKLNLDHDKRALRELVVPSLALVADQIFFNDKKLKKRTAHNLEIKHMYSDWCLCLLAATKGEAKDKKAQFQQWLAEYEHNDDVRSILENLIKGGLVPNPFLSHFLWVQQYITLRLACFPDPSFQQMPLPGMEQSIQKTSRRKTRNTKQEQKSLFASDSEESLPDLLWKRVRNHPLMDSHIEIEGIK